MFYSSKKIDFWTKGFTLFELLVVMSIVIVVTAITFANFPNFSSKLSLELLAQDIAISIRQAQVYGTTVYGTVGVGMISKAYGVHFPPLQPEGSEKSYKFALFADLLKEDIYEPGIYTNNGQYDTNEPDDFDFFNCGNPLVGGNECLERFTVSGRDRIAYLCHNYMDSGGEYPATLEGRINNCKSDPENLQYGSLDVVFKRPNLWVQRFHATKRGAMGGEGSIEEWPTDIPITNIGIVVESVAGYQRTVVVWLNGQISIDKE